jgi:Na+/proline symporter
MSTMSTQVNWGSSIIVNDVYRRFVNPGATERQLVWYGRLATVGLMVVACVFALLLENALQVFEIILLIGAGTGLLFLLRWFWWRVNAATELTAMIVSFVVAIYFQFIVGDGLEAWEKLVLSVSITTAVWLIVAFVTKPTDEEVLVSFYRRVLPGGPGWRRVIRIARERNLEIDSTSGSDLPYALLCSVIGAVAIYSLLFATGFILYGQHSLGLIFGLMATGGFVLLGSLWSRLRFDAATRSDA